MSSMSSDIMDRVRKRYSVEYDEPQQKQQEQDIGEFKKLIDFISQNNNTDMWTWTFSQSDVMKAQSDMMSIFNNYMFEMMKPQFVKFCKDGSLDVIKTYVDTAIETSKNYVSPTVAFEEEKKQLQEMVKQQSLIIEQLKNSKEVIKI